MPDEYRRKFVIIFKRYNRESEVSYEAYFIFYMAYCDRPVLAKENDKINNDLA